MENNSENEQETAESSQNFPNNLNQNFPNNSNQNPSNNQNLSADSDNTAADIKETKEKPPKKNKIDEIKLHELTLQAVFDAYFDCRKRKRNTMQSMNFEFDQEKNLFKLYQELKDGTYEIGRSICFVVTVPKPREVWAGAFRDRIVHHLIYNAVKERFENRFIQDTFSCIPNRGTLAGAQRARDFA